MLRADVAMATEEDADPMSDGISFYGNTARDYPVTLLGLGIFVRFLFLQASNRRRGQCPLLHGLGIPLHLPQSRMTGDGSNLISLGLE